MPWPGPLRSSRAAAFACWTSRRLLRIPTSISHAFASLAPRMFISQWMLLRRQSSSSRVCRGGHQSIAGYEWGRVPKTVIYSAW